MTEEHVAKYRTDPQLPRGLGCYTHVTSLTNMAPTVAPYERLVDWTGVRAIYKRLSDEFHVLTGAFNITLPLEQKYRLDVLLAGIDCVDRTLDALEAKEDRDALTEAMLSYLEGERDHLASPHASAELSTRLNAIRQIVGQTGISEPFMQAARIIFDQTEKKRHTQEAGVMLDMVEREGAATAQLPLSVMRSAGSPDFRRFFQDLCQMMGLADLLLDAREDYRTGQMRVRPTVSLYIRILWRLTCGGWKVQKSFPQPWAFIRYCLRFLRALLAEGG